MGKLSEVMSNGYAGAAIATMRARDALHEPRFRRAPIHQPRPRLRAQDRPASWLRFGRGSADPEVAFELVLDAVFKRDRRRLRNIRIHHRKETP